MKVFLDTNVIASAFATRGLCSDLYREVILSHEFVISSSVLAELKDVFKRKFAFPDNLINEIQDTLQANATIEDSPVRHEIPNIDNDDQIILSEAIESGVTIFVTGDKKILNLKKINSLKILSPREFWNKLAL